MARISNLIGCLFVAFLLGSCDGMQAAAPAPSKASAASGADGAQAGDPNAGAFDFYVLSLSWSPTYCLEQGGEADPAQCGAEQPFDFIVHGLWPQRENGSLRYCSVSGERPDTVLVQSMLDIMPSTGLVRHQWNAHGACSGLEPAAYFAAVRKARAAIEIPEAFKGQAESTRLAPADVERMFVAANPGLPEDGIAVTCEGARLEEVRICLTKDLTFRTCSEVDRRACKRDNLSVPVWRGR